MSFSHIFPLAILVKKLQLGKEVKTHLDQFVTSGTCSVQIKQKHHHASKLKVSPIYLGPN
jgi:hypothetical protein